MTLDSFLSGLPYRADPFQIEAAEALRRGDGVVVTAPTGSGKTLIAEMAIRLAVDAGRRAFYTTPIKALSNQKFTDLATTYGRDRVGLLTGDNVVNPHAPVVVMTTEVLRNMIYADADTLDDVEYVVLDEVHYLQDRFRGAVWEEIIIHAPEHVRLVALSATIANADEFAGWLNERRRGIELIVATERPVPLENHYLMADRMGEERLVMEPLFTERDGRRRPNPRIDRALSMERGRRRRYTTPGRVEVVGELADRSMLPAIYFIFSRAGCNAAALSVLESGLRLTSPDERQTIRSVAEARTDHLGENDLAALEYGRWLAGLEAGVAPHHAGMVPAFKETVEELFSLGLIRVVFATETLALGINMPARTVVLDSLSKFDGEGHRLLEPGDYTQLTGRAGRRGIDVIGHGIVLHSRFVGFEQVVDIAAAGSHPLRSSFRPTYNMAANLIANYSEEEAEALLSASFAQYQRDGSATAGLAALEAMQDRLGNELAMAECERGSVAEYLLLLEQPDDPADPGSAPFSPGDVIDVDGGRRDGRYMVLKRLARSNTGLRYLVLSTSGRTSTITARDFTGGVARVTRLELGSIPPKKDHKGMQRLLRRLRAVPRGQPKPRKRKRRTIDHPVATCPDAGSHVSWLRKARRTERRIGQYRDRLRQQGIGLVGEFHAIHDLLDDWAYTDGWSLAPRGDRLRHIYCETDLALVECIERGLLSDLEPPGFASLVSCFVYEPRNDTESAVAWPDRQLQHRYDRVLEVVDELAEMERHHRLPATRSPDAGFVEAAMAWAEGAALEELPGSALAPGDFVRVCRQLVDLLRQIRDTFGHLEPTARAAIGAIDRGVVAAQGVRT